MGRIAFDVRASVPRAFREEGEMMEKKYIGVKDLALYLGIKVSTVYSWIHSRKIPYYKVGRLPKFDLGEIEKWMIEQKVNPAE